MSRDDKEIQDKDQRRRVHRGHTGADVLFNEVMPTIRWLSGGRPKAWQPLTDVYETQENVIVKVEIAGMSEEGFTISLSNRSLRIAGTRRDPDYKLAYQQLEIPYGHFCSEVFLPYAVAYDEIHASYEGGFLTVVLPKAKTHHVRIKDEDAPEPTVE